MGIGGAQIVLANKDKNLVHILKEEFSIPMEMWLVMHEDLKTTKRIRSLFSYLTQELADFVIAPHPSY